jgi:hypothetical protein
MTDATEALAESAPDDSSTSARTTPYLAANDGRRQFASDVDPRNREISYHFNSRGSQSKFGWQQRRASWEGFASQVLSHVERHDKEGPVYVPGHVMGETRSAKAVAYIDCLVFDLDVATREDFVAASDKIKSAGVACYIHSTHSHLSRLTRVHADEFKAFCVQQDLAPESAVAAQKFLRDKKRYPESIVASASVHVLMQQSASGVMTVLAHEPLFKLRVVFPLDRSYSVVEMMEQRKFSEADARARAYIWMLKTVAQEFGLAYDAACKDA